jgi:hypothetical protein
VQGQDEREAHQQVIAEVGVSKRPVLQQEFYGEAQARIMFALQI